MVKIQCCMILTNCDETILRVLNSLVNKVDRIHIVYNDIVDNTLKIINEFKKENNKIKICLKEHKFIDHASSRNYCLRTSSKNYDYTIMLDDSYELVGDIKKELGNIPYDKIDDVIDINVKITGGDFQSYKSSRIITNGSKARYTGKIHETINKSPSCCLINCFIRDLDSIEGLKRTYNRYSSDLDILDSLKDPRSKYLLAETLHRLYEIKNPMVNKQNVVDAYIKRIEIGGPDYEQIFMCHITLAFMDVNPLEHFSKAIQVFPERSGECYLYLFLKTKKLNYINLAYKFKDIGYCRYLYDLTIPELIKIYYTKYVLIMPQIRKIKI